MFRSLLLTALLFSAFVLVTALLEQSHPEALSALPKPSTKPFGLRLAFSDTKSSLTLTWSSTAPLSQIPCVELEQLDKPCTSSPSEHQATIHKQISLSTAVNLSSTSVRRNIQSLAASLLLEKKESTTNCSSITLLCGTSTPFIEPATGIAAHFIHSVSLNSLTRNAHYAYRCGNDADGWSNPTQFRAPPSSSSPLPLQTRERISNDDLHPTKLLLVGDMGVYRSLTLPALISDASSGEYSAVIHVGDLAYDLGHYQGRKAQHFLQLIEPLSTSLPYMVAAGNHEAAWNFSHYRGLFRMPGWEERENLYYSFDIGQIHVAVYNTEVFFWPESYQTTHMAAMYTWLEADLKAANAHRESVPWIIVIGHRPMYCAAGTTKSTSTKNSTTDSTTENFRCGWESEASRKGLPSICPHNNPRWCHPITPNSTLTRIDDNDTIDNSISSTNNGDGDVLLGKRKMQMPTQMQEQISTFPIEELLHKYKVDVAVYGHVHDYERYFPVYNYTYETPDPSGAYERSSSFLSSNAPITDVPSRPVFYSNPRSTVHVTSGAGGNSEMRIGPLQPPQGPCAESAPWCAFQSGFGPSLEESYDFSHSRVVAYNATHLRWEQYSSTFRRVIDEWWVVQTQRN